MTKRAIFLPRALALTNCMMGIDVELGRLERVMLNADKPPTREWISNFFCHLPLDQRLCRRQV